MNASGTMNYQCTSCETPAPNSYVPLNVGDIIKFGTTKYAGGAGRYPGSYLKGKRMNILTPTPIPSNMAFALEKILILEYSLGGFGDQRGRLENWGIQTTHGKPIQNPIFR